MHQVLFHMILNQSAIKIIFFDMLTQDRYTKGLQRCKLVKRVTNLDVHIFANKTNTLKTKNSNPMVNFLPILSIRNTVTNNPGKQKN